MKTFRENSNGAELVIGTADEIKSFEKSMRRAWLKDKSNVWPSHLDKPKYNSTKIYGIGVEREERHSIYYILSADTILRLMYEL